ncbi:hypothetical protein Leryth_021985 [Lithospermum erythrorhizon]|nr:hypothetical protein Leryth_021985 [Lithospermum erythrorhizon]
MSKEKRDIRPELLKFAAASVLSLGGIFYSFIRKERSKISSDSQSKGSVGSEKHKLIEVEYGIDLAGIFFPQNISPQENSGENLSPPAKVNGEKDSHLLPEFDELLEDINIHSTETGLLIGEDMDRVGYAQLNRKEYTYAQKDGSGDAQEIQRLRQAVRILKERETDLEIQLLEYYGLKEQETAFVELQNRLKIKNMEGRLFSLKLESLQADKKRLEEQVSNHAKVSAELEAAKAQIKLLKRKLKSASERNKEQILALQERARKLQELENKDVEAEHGNIQVELRKLKDLEGETEELRKSNSTLKLEKYELTQKLEYVQLLATSVLDSDEVTVLKEERQSLQQKYENLKKEVEQLQADRCSDVEELVYLRWLNACLRYELRNYQPGPDTTVSRDLSRTLSPKSEEKVKQLILDYASKEGQDEEGRNFLDFDSDQWFTSQNSSHSDSEEESSIDMSSYSKTQTLKKPLVFGKLIRLLQGKDRGKHNRSVSGETSSCVEDLKGRHSGVSPLIDAVSAETDNRDLVKYAETLKVSRNISSRRSIFGSF